MTCILARQQARAGPDEYLECPGVWESDESCEDSRSDFCIEKEGEGTAMPFVIAMLVAIAVAIALNLDALAPGPSGA